MLKIYDVFWADILMKRNMTIRIGRAIFAVLIGLSVATLPTAAGFAASAQTKPVTQVSASDCDHHHNHNAPADKTQKTADDCGCMAACTLSCFNFTATGVSGIAYWPPAQTALEPVRTRTDLASLTGSPPFRPPRI